MEDLVIWSANHLPHWLRAILAIPIMPLSFMSLFAVGAILSGILMFPVGIYKWIAYPEYRDIDDFRDNLLSFSGILLIAMLSFISLICFLSVLYDSDH